MGKARLSVITDEFSWKLERALKSVQNFPEVRHVDLRGVNHKNVINLTPRDILQVKVLLRQFGEREVLCIASPAGKRRTPQSEKDRKETLGEVERAIEVARQFGAPYVRVFAFKREPDRGDNYQDAVTLLSQFGEEARAAGVLLVVENEGGYWGQLPEEMSQLLQDVDSPSIWNLLDPGNYLNQNRRILTNEDVALLADRTKYVHVKDARKARRGYVIVGTGDIPYLRTFQQLRGLESDLGISLETHMGGLFRKRNSTRCMRNLIDTAYESEIFS